MTILSRRNCIIVITKFCYNENQTSALLHWAFISTQLVAQSTQLWGITIAGGTYNGGTIFSVNVDGTDFNSVHSFNAPEGYQPMGNLFMASDSNLYGVCYLGGYFNNPILYRYNPVNGDYSHVCDFDQGSGSSGVIEINGTLYGNTYGPTGAIYSYDLATGIFADLYVMSIQTGYNAYNTPVIAINGKLYGTTQYGGVNENGTIYSFDLADNTYSVAHYFDFLNGGVPLGGLILANDGKLYGMSSLGGVYGRGVLFSFDPSDSSYDSVFNFDGVNGGSPYGTLMQGSNGILYGLATHGGSDDVGVIFSFDLSGNTYTKLFDFTDIDGIAPFGNLIQVENLLCGTTYAGGANGYGTVFNFNLLTNIYTKLLDFNSINGANPNGGLITLGRVTTGVKVPAADEFTIYPNPVTQYAICKAPSFNNQKVNVEVSDLSGKEVLSQQLVMRNSQFKIDLSHVTSGIYLLELMTGDEKKIAKVVKE